MRILKIVRILKNCENTENCKNTENCESGVAPTGVKHMNFFIVTVIVNKKAFRFTSKGFIFLPIYCFILQKGFFSQDFLLSEAISAAVFAISENVGAHSSKIFMISVILSVVAFGISMS